MYGRAAYAVMLALHLSHSVALHSPKHAGVHSAKHNSSSTSTSSSSYKIPIFGLHHTLPLPRSRKSSPAHPLPCKTPNGLQGSSAQMLGPSALDKASVATWLSTMKAWRRNCQVNDVYPS